MKRVRRTMEEPGSGVVSDDTEGDGGPRGDLHGVATHGVSLAVVQGRVELGVVGGVVLRAADELHVVSVQMAGEGTKISMGTIV